MVRMIPGWIAKLKNWLIKLNPCNGPKNAIPAGSCLQLEEKCFIKGEVLTTAPFLGGYKNWY